VLIVSIVQQAQIKKAANAFRSASVTPTFQGEVQFLGWNDDHARGATVKFQLADDAELDAFRRMTVRKGKQAGQRLAMVLVEIADDGTPAQPEPAREGPRFPGGLCGLAVRWCEDQHFRVWLDEQYPDAARLFLGTPATPEQRAKLVVCGICQIQSRKQLDTDDEAASRFKTAILRPYSEQRRRDGLDG
jgi:hypothetical protein